ncbi:hypothetical protein BD311DRAFT_602321, partial [Dichomitus squalens]
VTVDLTAHSSVAGLLWECRKTATIESLSDLEKTLLEYPIHHTSSSLDRSFTLNIRKSISWKEELENCF